MSSPRMQGEMHNLLENNNEEEEEDENDMIEIQLQSSVIKVNYVNLFTYSKLIRDEYQTLKKAKLNLSGKFKTFQKEFKITDDNSALFFSSFKNAKFLINNQNYGDLCKLSSYFKVKRLTKILDQYKANHNFDPDFIINEILKQIANDSSYNLTNDDFSISMESTLCSKVNECLQIERFGLLPISMVYRIISKSEEISSDLLFDFISKSIENRCTLFAFLNVENLSDSKLDELIGLYDQYKGDAKNFYFQCLPTANLKLLKTIKDENKSMKTQIDQLNEKCNKLQGYLDDVCKFINYTLSEKDWPGSSTLSYTKSCSERGNEMASWMLGFIYANESDDVDETKLLSYFQKSIDEGNPYPMCLLGLLYEDGRSIEKDITKSIEYYKKSVENGNPIALISLGQLYEGQNDYLKAVECYTQAASQGISTGLVYLGDIYMEGKEGIDQDYSKAIDYYKQASESGNYKALNKLGEIYEDGKGVEKNLSEALACFEKSNEILNEYDSRRGIGQVKEKISENDSNTKKKPVKKSNKK